MNHSSNMSLASKNGFTLLEVLVSIFILVTVLSTVFASYTGTFRIIGETESQADIYQMARVAFERMSEDLQSVYAYTPETSGGELLSFVGESTEMHFPAKAHLSFGKDKKIGQLAVITYTGETKPGQR